MTFTLTIVAIIVGRALYKEYDPETGEFKNIGLALIYAIVFVASVFILVRNFVNGRSLF